MAIGLHITESLFNLRMAAEAERAFVRANEAMAAAFERADLIVCATNPGAAFATRVTLPREGASTRCVPSQPPFLAEPEAA